MITIEKNEEKLTGHAKSFFEGNYDSEHLIFKRSEAIWNIVEEAATTSEIECWNEESLSELLKKGEENKDKEKYKNDIGRLVYLYNNDRPQLCIECIRLAYTLGKNSDRYRNDMERIFLGITKEGDIYLETDYTTRNPGCNDDWYDCNTTNQMLSVRWWFGDEQD